MEFIFTIARLLEAEQETGINILDENERYEELLKMHNDFLESAKSKLERIEMYTTSNDKIREEINECKKVVTNNKKEFEDNKKKTKEKTSKIKFQSERIIELKKEINEKLAPKMDKLKNEMRLEEYRYALELIPHFTNEPILLDDITHETVEDFYIGRNEALSSGFMRRISENKNDDSSDTGK